MWTDITRAKHDRKGLRYSSDMTDGEWEILEPMIPLHRALVVRGNVTQRLAAGIDSAALLLCLA